VSPERPEVLVNLDRLQQRALMAGAVCAGISVAGAFFAPGQFFQSYLFGYIFWVGVTLGFLGILMLHHLVSGAWGFVIQRIAEAGAKTIGMMALLFIPIFAGLGQLYPWMRPDALLGGEIMKFKSAYLSLPFFAGRAVVYFGFWICSSMLLSRWSQSQDQTADPRFTRSSRLFSAPGLIAYVLTATFASIDWIMSLEPGWHSTIYGMLVVVSQVLSGLALAVIALTLLAESAPFADILTKRHFHHLGNMLLTFTILWAYMEFSQLIIIWSGNLPNENTWYMSRLGQAWGGVAVFVLVVHFFVPFLLLLSRQAKRSAKFLALIGALIMVMQLIDDYWLIAPAFHPNAIHLHWLDVSVPAAMGGLWVAAFIGMFKRRSMVPLHDPRFAVVLANVKG
jgi:hypothetical protein